MLRSLARLLVYLAAWSFLPEFVHLATAFGQTGATGEWRYYGGDAGSTNYSALSQINKDNVKDLRIAWRWKTDNFGSTPDVNLEVTPIMVNGVLYATAGSSRAVVAIDAATGETLWMWRHDEQARGAKAPLRAAAGRGVAYWTDGNEARILHVTRGYRLVALDAKTGVPIPDFGDHGMVDLHKELDRPVPADGQIGLSSPPLVVGNVVVVGAAFARSPTKEFVAGPVRGYDVRSGKRLWLFRTIPRPGEIGNDSWEDDSWSYTGHTGVWAPMSADLELGYLYLPVETPTNDNYGGHRPGKNVFAESLVCVEAATGKRVWHFQIVHHGLWDYDLPSAPILVDIAAADGRNVKAVAQLTKHGFVFVFDRVTGQPLWPIEERPVPQSDVPGEKTSPTQPFPSKPLPFERQGLTADNLIDFTPELKAEALKIASQYRMGPLFTPPSVAGAATKGTWFLPAGAGGANWPGGAVDAKTGVLYVPSVTSAFANALVADRSLSSMNYVGGWVGGFGGAGRAAIANQPDQGPQGLPIVKPPWGRITAIDLKTGEHLWVVPNGDTPEFVKKHPALKGLDIPKTGQPGRAGVMVTATLLFAGEGNGLFASPPGAGGPMFRAYDKTTGAVIWEFKLPANQGGVPMTYMIRDKQYIVVAVGAAGHPGELIALALP